MLRPLLILSSLAASLDAQVSLVHLGTVDVAVTSNASNPEYIGSNPSAVAWNGTDLFVAGYNNSGQPAQVAIVKVTTPLTNPTFGPVFGGVPNTPNSRGYSGLDISGGLLVAAYDPGAVAPEGISGWDLSGNNLWLKSARGSSGVGVDPGFFGADPGTGWTTFGSSNRALQDSATGADIYTTATGMAINAGPTQLWRDMDFDPLFGDVWARKTNKVIHAPRIGGNATGTPTVFIDATQADFVNGQNIAYVRQAADQVIFWNDRSATNAGQDFVNVIKCNSAFTAAPLVIDYGTFFAPSGAGYYDFSYDHASGTLAILDFVNRAVYLFAVTVFSEYGTGCQGQGGIAPSLRATGDARANGAITYRVASAAPLSIGLFAFGQFQAFVPLPFPGNCLLLVQPLLLVDGAFVTGPGPAGSGTGSVVLPIPPGVSGFSLTTQGAILEGGDINQLRTSNGVQIVLF